MEIRARHWLFALSLATLAHAALVTAVNLQPRTPRPAPAIVINLGETGAPDGASGGGAGRGTQMLEPLTDEPVQALAATDSPTPVRETERVEQVEVREILPPPVPPARPIIERPKPKPEPKPKPKPKITKASPPKPLPATPPARRKDQRETIKATEPATGSVRAVGRGQDAGTGAEGNSTGRGGTGTGAGRGSGAGGQGVANYQGRLVAWLNRHKRYPDRARRLRQEGTVKVSFTIDQRGRLLSHRIVGGSGHPLLDQEVAAMLKRASPMPAFPPGMSQTQLTVTVPISFDLH